VRGKGGDGESTAEDHDRGGQPDPLVRKVLAVQD
jgi:hypothetical protein